VGALSVNTLNSILILLMAFLAVFLQAALHGVRQVFGAQIDLLPALMVYAALSANLTTVTLLAVFGGLSLDSLSANPLGVSVLPLFVIGLAIHSRRELILRGQLFAQFVLGLIAGAVVPALTLLTLLSTGNKPLLGWGSLWQWAVMSAGGGIATPIFFGLLGLCHRALSYRRVSETSFRPDREIRRGRF
jgi:cell shape-determining protein MreD